MVVSGVEFPSSSPFISNPIARPIAGRIPLPIPDRIPEAISGLISGCRIPVPISGPILPKYNLHVTSVVYERRWTELVLARTRLSVKDARGIVRNRNDRDSQYNKGQEPRKKVRGPWSKQSSMVELGQVLNRIES
jgi:hypothetical protein